MPLNTAGGNEGDLAATHKHQNIVWNAHDVPPLFMLLISTILPVTELVPGSS